VQALCKRRQQLPRISPLSRSSQFAIDCAVHRIGQSEAREVLTGIASGRYQQRDLDRRRIEACTTQWLNVAARCVALVPTAAAGICAAGN